MKSPHFEVNNSPSPTVFSSVSPPVPIVASSKPNMLRGYHRGIIADEVVSNNLVPRNRSTSLGMDSMLLIICSNRPDYLKRSLSHVLKYHPLTSVPISISQDGNHPAVSSIIDDFFHQMSSKASTVTLKHIQHHGRKDYENGYFALADHFQYALHEVFSDAFIKRVIILEEDLEIASDFFEYFAATAPILDTDATLLAASAWNDNGFNNLVKDPEALYRSDFFPGLGWMITRSIWEELSIKWPRAYWDDWLREPAQRKDRNIIRPEICRTLHFGQHGVSNAQYSDFLGNIQLNTEYTAFTSLDLSYLLESNWDHVYLVAVRNAKEIDREELQLTIRRQGGQSLEEVKVRYSGLDGRAPDSFPSIARQVGVMDNVKAGVPRTAYMGIVSFWLSGVKVHLVPKNFT